MIYEISSIDDPRVALFATMTETQLRNRLNAEQGLFIAESPKVIRVALQAGYEPQALLCEQKHIEGDAADIIESHPSMPVYTIKIRTPITDEKSHRGRKAGCPARTGRLIRQKRICGF